MSIENETTSVEDARDAARYRWIAKNAHFTGSYKNVGGFGVCVKLDVLESEGIDAAIDAAMSATPPAGEPD